MPNPARGSESTHLAITMVGLARLHDRYLRGMKWGLVLGDALEKDMRWIAEIERILIGSGYYDAADVRQKHLEVDGNWLPQHDKEESDG